jgi:hypothetical protein
MKKFIKNVKISFVRIYFMMFLLFSLLLCPYAGAEKINFDKESFLDEINLRNKIIYDTCEGKSKCIDGFKKGEFGVNEIGIKKYDLNNEDTKDDAIVCFYSNYFCGARGTCAQIVINNNLQDIVLHGDCKIEVLEKKHFGYSDILIPCELDEKNYAILHFDGKKYYFAKHCKNLFL